MGKNGEINRDMNGNDKVKVIGKYRYIKRERNGEINREQQSEIDGEIIREINAEINTERKVASFR